MQRDHKVSTARNRLAPVATIRAARGRPADHRLLNIPAQITAAANVLAAITEPHRLPPTSTVIWQHLRVNNTSDRAPSSVTTESLIA